MVKVDCTMVQSDGEGEVIRLRSLLFALAQSGMVQLATERMTRGIDWGPEIKKFLKIIK